MDVRKGVRVAKVNTCINLSMKDPLAIQAVAERLDKITGINKTVRENLRKAIATGISKGESTNQIAERIRKEFQASKHRARLIARTEVNAAASDARDIQFDKTFGKDHEREWITARDVWVRPSHQLCDGVRVNRGEKYPNGLTRPHQQGAPAEEVCNCRCIEIAHPKEAEDI